MCRYHGGEWLRLPTKVVGEKTTHFKFTAETRDLSLFAITVIVHEGPILTELVASSKVKIGDEFEVKLRFKRGRVLGIRFEDLAFTTSWHIRY